MKSLDVRPIINNFYNDIYNDSTKSDWEAYALLIIPILFGQIGVIRPVDQQFMLLMATALTILFGFTFNSLITTAKYSSKDDRLEEKVVYETRITTSYALLINLVALITIIGVSIFVVDYSSMSQLTSIAVSAGVYAILTHYLLVMIQLMRYLYLLAIGGAFEEREPDGSTSSAAEESKIKIERR